MENLNIKVKITANGYKVENQKQEPKKEEKK